MDKCEVINNHKASGRNTLFIILYLLISAFFLLLLASRSSFLYPCNDWNDANSYFSVGKALFNGKMPYRDVFDQKGMYLYFFYGLAYLVSHTTFAGVFVLEVVLATCSLVGIFHILLLYMRQSVALALSPIVSAVVICSYSFYWGGSAEEVCFPFLIWGLYIVLRYFKKQYPQENMSRANLFVGGLLAGMVANIKFTSLGFFFAWMMWVAFVYLVRKDLLGAIKACLIFLLGMALPFLPWLIYFGINNGLQEWYYGYVYINVFVYSNLQGEGPGLGERVYILEKILYWLIRQDLSFFVFVIPGVLWSVLGKNKKWMERLLVPVLFFFLFLGIYIGGSELPYYALPLAVFTVLGFGLLGSVLDKLIWIRREGASQSSHHLETRRYGCWPYLISCMISLILSVGIIWTTSINIPHMLVKKEDVFLYKFRDIVMESENPTLLNIGCLDAGLYTVCDIVPTCRWFQTQTLPIDDVLAVQEEYIREGQTDYVLARDSYPEVVWEQYELVGEEPWSQGELDFTYYLFRRKSS